MVNCQPVSRKRSSNLGANNQANPRPRPSLVTLKLYQDGQAVYLGSEKSNISLHKDYALLPRQVSYS